MTIEPPLNPERTAVLSMDMHSGIVALYVSDREAFTSRAASLLGYCRGRGVMVIHVQVGFRPGFPEISPRNSLFNAIRESPERQKLFQGNTGKIHPAVAPVGDDIVITKHRISAFTGTDLDMILRAKGVDAVVMFGIATSGVVLSTLLDAVDADYRVIVVEDCCADRDAELHSALLEKLFPLRGTVATAAEVLASL
jgi:nicotinamidase-related amidase